MTTRQFHYLVTIAEAGNLSKASGILGISQPALSKFLTNYEDSLGFLLFLRYNRQLTPTAVGRYVLDTAQQILDEQTRMQQTIRTLTDTDHIQIRLATAPNRGAIIYSRIYNKFSRRYPEVSLSLTELYASEQPSAICHGKIDLAIGSGTSSGKVSDLPIAQEELLVSLPVSHPLSSQERIHLSDLQDTPFVLQGPQHSIRILAEELFQDAGFNPLIAFESPDVMLVDSMLHQAVGAGLVSHAHVFPCKELVYRPLDPPVYQTLHIRYPLGHTLTEPEKYLAGLLIHERLSDARYTAIPSARVEELLQFADSNMDTETDRSHTSTTHAAESLLPTHHAAPDVNLSTPLLQYLIAIVDEKSLTKAAEKYYLTQPVLSRYLRNAESMLCTQLFTRVHNRLMPTNAGKVFVNSSRNMLQMEADMNNHLSSYKMGHGGGIYIQYDSKFLDLMQDSIIKDFKTTHPDVELYFSSNSREHIQQSVLNASTDLGLFFSCEPHHPILDYQILYEDQLLYYFHDSDTTALPPDVSLAHSMNPQKVMLAPKGSSLREEQVRLLADLSDSPAEIVCEAGIDILQILTQTQAADTIFPAALLSAEAMQRSRVFLPKQPFYLILAHHPGRNLPPSALDLIQQLKNHTYTK